MIAIVDYSVGNLFSLKSSFAAIGVEVSVTADPDELAAADGIVLPGVGAFEDAADKLRVTGLDQTLITLAKAGKPLLGICLGMQMLFEKSYEYGEHRGLGLIAGNVDYIGKSVPGGLKIPHIGWNELSFEQHPLFKYIRQGDCVYFVHSYAGVQCPDVIATTEYGATLTAAVAKGNVMGCQFHPEKSGKVGLAILRAFSEMKEGQIC